MTMHQGLDLSRFKKVGSDKKTTTLRHGKGHEIKIAHSGLTPKMREQLELLPMAEGGDVHKPDTKVPEVESRANSDAAMPEPAAKSAKKDDGVPRNKDGMIDAGTVTPSSYYDTPAPQAAAPEPMAAPSPAPVAKDVATPETPDTSGISVPPLPKAPDNWGDPDPVKMTADDMAWQQDLRNGHIHPMTYHDLFAKKDTAGKVGTLFGMMVGGMGSGLTHQPNALLSMMTKEIDNDLDAQKASKTNAVSWLKLAQQHELQKAQIEQMGYQNQLTQGQIKKIPSEIALSEAKAKQAPYETERLQAERRHLDADTDVLATTAAKNKMALTLFHDLGTKVDSMPEGPQKQAATSALQNTVGPAVQQGVIDNNAKAASQVKLQRAARQQGQGAPKTLQPKAPDTGVDWQQFNQLQKQGAMAGTLGMPVVGIPPSDIGSATHEAEKVQDNRAMLKSFLDSYDKLDKMALAGHLQPDFRKAEINSLGASIARETAGRFNASEMAGQMAGMFPEAGDWKSTRREKRRKAIEFFRMQEAGTPTLDRFGLKTKFPFAGGGPGEDRGEGGGGSSEGGGGSSEGGDVKIRSPKGTVMTVPRSRAKYYIDKGGKVVP